MLLNCIFQKTAKKCPNSISCRTNVFFSLPTKVSKKHILTFQDHTTFLLILIFPFWHQQPFYYTSLIGQSGDIFDSLGCWNIALKDVHLFHEEFCCLNNHLSFLYLSSALSLQSIQWNPVSPHSCSFGPSEVHACPERTRCNHHSMAGTSCRAGMTSGQHQFRLDSHHWLTELLPLSHYYLCPLTVNHSERLLSAWELHTKLGAEWRAHE